MSNNSDNPKIGKNFQDIIELLFKNEHPEKVFQQEYAISIGNPSKPHKFDIVSTDKTIVVECKCYTYTDSGNIPSAKLMGLNEAAFYLSFLPEYTEKIIVMKYAYHEKRAETLAEYYFRMNRHLLRDIKILEYNSISNSIRLVGQN